MSWLNSSEPSLSCQWSGDSNISLRGKRGSNRITILHNSRGSCSNFRLCSCWWPRIKWGHFCCVPRSKQSINSSYCYVLVRGKQRSCRPARCPGFGQALFFKEGQGSEKCKRWYRQMPGGSDSLGRSGRNKTGEGSGKEFSRNTEATGSWAWSRNG